MGQKIKCPNWKCRSIECVPLTDGKKYSVGKGIVGAAVGATVAAPLALAGALVGFNHKKKMKFMCTKCGEVFEVKV